MGSFTYLGSTVDRLDGTDADVKVKIGKARGAFNQLENVWGSSDLPININVRIFNSIVKPILLYGAETWRTTVATMKRCRCEEIWPYMGTAGEVGPGPCSLESICL